MGGRNSVENITRTINETIVNTTISSLQKASNELVQTQSIKIKCDSADRGRYYNECLKIVTPILQSSGVNDFIKAARETCGSQYECGASGVNLNQSIVANMSINQLQQAKSEFERNLTSNIEQSAKQKNGVLQFGNDTRNIIENQTKIISNNSLSLFQDVTNNLKQTQELQSDGGPIRLINITAAANIVSNSVQTNNAINKAVENIATQIKQEADQSGGDLLRKIFIFIGIVIGVLILLGITLVIIKNTRKKPNTQQGLNFDIFEYNFRYK